MRLNVEGEFFPTECQYKCDNKTTLQFSAKQMYVALMVSVYFTFLMFWMFSLPNKHPFSHSTKVVSMCFFDIFCNLFVTDIFVKQMVGETYRCALFWTVKLALKLVISLLLNVSEQV